MSRGKALSHQSTTAIMTRHVTPITMMIAGQRPWDTFMFRPSPPAGPRSLKVTFGAFSVSNARRYGAMLLAEAPEWERTRSTAAVVVLMPPHLSTGVDVPD